MILSKKQDSGLQGGWVDTFAARPHGPARFFVFQTV